MCTPVFRAFKQRWPQCHIAALTMFSGAADILSCYREIDEVLHFDFLRKGVWRSLRFASSLRKRRFDICFLGYPSNRLEYNVLSFLTGALVRTGHRYRHFDLSCLNWLNTRTVREDDTIGNIAENLRLVSLVTGRPATDGRVLPLQLPKLHHEMADAWLACRGLTPDRFVGFHTGSSTAKNHTQKRWPSDHFVTLGQMLAREGYTILLFGGVEEIPLKDHIAREIGPEAHVVDLPSILSAAALMLRCIHFVSNDSALLHVAGALGVDCSACFGPTNPAWVRMDGSPRLEFTAQLPCQPCFYYSPRYMHCKHGDFRCLDALTPEHVHGVISARLAARIPSSTASAG